MTTDESIVKQAYELAALAARRLQRNLGSMLRCRECGHRIRRGLLDSDPDCWVQTLPGIKHLAPEDCAEAEYVTRCPDCGARDSFEVELTP